MRVLLLILGLSCCASAFAAIDVHEFESPEQERRYRALIEELRCTVCQNQNIAGSNAELAQDLRSKTYQLIRDGKSDAEILAYMVERYGNFVLYRPPLTAGTLLLWGGPFILFAVGGFALIRIIQRRRANRDETASENHVERRAKAAALLREGGDKA